MSETVETCHGCGCRITSGDTGVFTMDNLRFCGKCADPDSPRAYADALRAAEKMGDAFVFATKEASVFKHLISPPEFSTRPTPIMVEAFEYAAEDFLCAGGTVTLREWCLMPEVLRDAFHTARQRILDQQAGAVPPDAKVALDAMEGALPK